MSLCKDDKKLFSLENYNNATCIGRQLADSFINIKNGDNLRFLKTIDTEAFFDVKKEITINAKLPELHQIGFQAFGANMRDMRRLSPEECLTVDRPDIDDISDFWFSRRDGPAASNTPCADTCEHERNIVNERGDTDVGICNTKLDEFGDALEFGYCKPSCATASIRRINLTLDLPKIQIIRGFAFAGLGKIELVGLVRLKVIHDNAFSNFNGVLIVISSLPELVRIGENAFSSGGHPFAKGSVIKLDGMMKLQDVGRYAFAAFSHDFQFLGPFPELTHIRNGAFMHIGALFSGDGKSKYIPKHRTVELTGLSKLKYVGEQAFEKFSNGAFSFDRQGISNSLQYIGDDAFGFVMGKSITIKGLKSLKVIGARAFNECSRYTVEGDAPNLQQIGAKAFNCQSSVERTAIMILAGYADFLGTITVNDFYNDMERVNITFKEAKTFNDASRMADLINVKLADQITEEFFKYHRVKLTNLEGLLTIGDYAFTGFSGAGRVSGICSKLVDIGKYAFSDIKCIAAKDQLTQDAKERLYTKLHSVEVLRENDVFTVDLGNLRSLKEINFGAFNNAELRLRLIGPTPSLELVGSYAFLDTFGIGVKGDPKKSMLVFQWPLHTIEMCSDDSLHIEYNSEYCAHGYKKTGLSGTGSIQTELKENGKLQRIGVQAFTSLHMPLLLEGKMPNLESIGSQAFYGVSQKATKITLVSPTKLNDVGFAAFGRADDVSYVRVYWLDSSDDGSRTALYRGSTCGTALAPLSVPLEEKHLDDSVQERVTCIPDMFSKHIKTAPHRIPRLPNLEVIGSRALEYIGFLGKVVNLDFPKLKRIENLAFNGMTLRPTYGYGGKIIEPGAEMLNVQNLDKLEYIGESAFASDVGSVGPVVLGGTGEELTTIGPFAFIHRKVDIQFTNTKNLTSVSELAFHSSTKAANTLRFDNLPATFNICRLGVSTGYLTKDNYHKIKHDEAARKLVMCIPDTAFARMPSYMLEDGESVNITSELYPALTYVGVLAFYDVGVKVNFTGTFERLEILSEQALSTFFTFTRHQDVQTKNTKHGRDPFGQQIHRYLGLEAWDGTGGAEQHDGADESSHSIKVDLVNCNNIREIGNGCFMGVNGSVRVVGAMDKLKHIGNKAFSSGKSIFQIDSVKNLETIGIYAFRSAGVVKITLNSSKLKIIPNGGFSMVGDSADLKNIITVTLEKNGIDSRRSSGSRSIAIKDVEEFADMVKSNVTVTMNQVKTLLGKATPSLDMESLEKPANDIYKVLEYLPRYAHIELHLPNLEVIERYAFDKVLGAVQAHDIKSIKVIESSAFEYAEASGLNSFVKFNSGSQFLTTIGARAFYSFRGEVLFKGYFPLLTSIGESAFDYNPQAIVDLRYMPNLKGMPYNLFNQFFQFEGQVIVDCDGKLTKHMPTICRPRSKPPTPARLLLISLVVMAVVFAVAAIVMRFST